MKRETIDLFNRIFKVLEPPPDLTLSQWADRYRRLSSESGSKGGKWNTEKAPWQREIMDAITDISVEKVVVMSAAQMGKTDARMWIGNELYKISEVTTEYNELIIELVGEDE